MQQLALINQQVPVYFLNLSAKFEELNVSGKTDVSGNQVIAEINGNQGSVTNFGSGNISQSKDGSSAVASSRKSESAEAKERSGESAEAQGRKGESV